MLTRLPMKTIATAGAAMVTLTVAVGCTLEFGGGASTVPTVTILRAEGAAEEAPSDKPIEVAGYGNFTGRIVLDGPVPSFPPLVTGALKDPDVCQSSIILEDDYRLVVDDASGGIQNVFVYLSRKPAGAKAADAESLETMVFDQKNCVFLPHASVVQTGQTVQLINSDPIAHNVNLKAKSNDPFNSVLKVSDTVGIPFTFGRSEREPVRIVCDFHAWMLAWQLPLDHPYGAVTAADGSFSIPDLPAGEHEFQVWHEGRRLLEHTVTIAPDQTVDETITVPAANLAIRPNPNPRTVVLSGLR